VGSIPASRTKLTYATLCGGVFVGRKPMFSLGFPENKLRRCTWLFATIRRAAGVSFQGFDAKTLKAKLFETPESFVRQGFAGFFGTTKRA
jgi:hypothetical protein